MSIPIQNFYKTKLPAYIKDMESQKLENLLNVALETTNRDEIFSNTIGVGYDKDTNSWELIVKYNGNLDFVRSLGGTVEELILGYAIIIIGEDAIEELIKRPEIEYVEIPKRLFYSVLNGKQVSCIPRLENSPYFLSGKNILIGILDSGLDLTDADFRNSDGTTRVRYFLDQTTGREWTEEEINARLQNSGEEADTLPKDVSGHGSAVSKIAAGNGNGSGARFRGVAPNSGIIVVKLGNSLNDSFPRTTQLMSGLTYAVKKAVSLNMPIAINISFGNTYGSHDGTGILERFMDNISEIGRSVICVGSGNEGNASGHAGGFLQNNGREIQQFSIGSYERSLSIQLWKNYSDSFRIMLKAPGGSGVLIDEKKSGKEVVLLGETRVLIYVGEPAPYSVNQEIYLEFTPSEPERFLNTGVWEIEFTGLKVVYGRYDLYMPQGLSRSEETVFYTPAPEGTFTIPSTAAKVITVGAYNGSTGRYAPFSGRGFLLNPGRRNRLAIKTVKPDILAPGENILISRKIQSVLPFLQNDNSSEYTVETVSGTSFATPFVTGSAALLMEWGIVRGNDPYLYGEKVKAYFLKGAGLPAGISQIPDSKAGWGTLCVADSIL